MKDKKKDKEKDKEKDKKKDLPAYLSLPYEPTCRLLFLVAPYLPLAYLPDPLPFAYLSDPLPFIVKKAKEPLPPASRATRADKEKDKKEGFVESKGAVADPLPLPLPLPPPPL